jgi:hypothetical protein
MPFSNSTCEPDLMEAMRAAFYRVCDVLQLSCDREDPLTGVVVTKIVELAKKGERDPEILCFTVLAELDMPLQESIPRSSPGGASLRRTSRTTPKSGRLRRRFPRYLRHWHARTPRLTDQFIERAPVHVGIAFRGHTTRS